MSRYSVIQFVDDLQFENLHYESDEWGTTALTKIATGERLLGAVENAKFQMLHPRRTEVFDYLCCGPFDVVSRELGEFLISKEIRLELLPIEMTYIGRIAGSREYFVMNILDQFDAMDLDKSDFSEYSPAAGGGVSKVTRLVLKSEALAASNAFVLKKLWVSLIKDELCVEILKAGFKGLRFESQDSFQFG